MTPADLLRLSVTASAPPSPVTMTLLADAGPCRNCDGTGRVTLNTYTPSADAEVCDAAEATVSALWPQGDAPAGDECAAYSAAPLDTPMPPAFVAALASLSPAEAGALDLDAIEARANAASAGPWVLRLGPHAIPEVHGPKYGVAFTFYGEGEGENDHADADAAFIAAARTDVPALLARVRELEAQLAAAQPAVARDALRNGRFTAHCCVCSAEWPLGVRDCPGCGHPDRDAGAVPDRDLCPHCGALDLDHVCPKSAATVAGEAFAAEHPEAAGRILG